MSILPRLLRIAFALLRPRPPKEKTRFSEGTPLGLPAHGLRPRYPCFLSDNSGVTRLRSFAPTPCKKKTVGGTPLGLPAHGPSTRLRTRYACLGEVEACCIAVVLSGGASPPVPLDKTEAGEFPGAPRTLLRLAQALTAEWRD